MKGKALTSPLTARLLVEIAEAGGIPRASGSHQGHERGHRLNAHRASRVQGYGFVGESRTGSLNMRPGSDTSAFAPQFGQRRSIVISQPVALPELLEPAVLAAFP